jgi:hypothetical protein
MKGPYVSVRGLLVLGVFGVLFLAAWALPRSKSEAAVAGRLDYGQFLLALLAGGAFVSTAVVVLMPPAWRRPAGFRLAAAWLGTAVALLAAEVAAYALPYHSTDNPWYLRSGQAFEPGEELPFERPPHLHWEGLSRGNLAILNNDDDPYASRVTFVTDFEGFRNSADQTQAELVFLGDSYTEAGNIPEEQTFVRQTAAALGRSARNLGRSGYTGPMELIVFRKYGLKCRPRAVVWQVAESNDLTEAILFQQWLDNGRPPGGNWFASPPSPGAIWKQRSPTGRLFASLCRPRRWPTGGTFRDRDGQVHEVRLLWLPGRAHSPVNHPGWPVLADSFRQGAQLLREEKIPLVIVLIPDKVRGLVPRLQLDERLLARYGPDWDLSEPLTLASHLQALCDELGIPFVDATPALRQAAAEGDLVYLPFDTHLSRRGHEVVRDLLVEPLRTACK